MLDTIQEMRPIYWGVSPADKRRMDLMFKRINQHKAVFADAKPLRPIIIFCILMLLEVYKISMELFHLQYKEIKRQRKALEAARLLAEDEPAQIEDENAEAEQLEMVEQLEATNLTA